MWSRIRKRLYDTQEPALPLAIFRIGYTLILGLEVVQLMIFRDLIFQKDSLAARYDVFLTLLFVVWLAAQSLTDYATYWAVRNPNQLDRGRGVIEIQKKPITVALDRFRKNQLKDNIRQQWQTIGHIRNEDKELKLKLSPASRRSLRPGAKQRGSEARSIRLYMHLNGRIHELDKEGSL
ncbi:hypothetical protein GCM10010912_04250 [Paenibacillus albidus]|uniref:Uncharacterized protein n=1 Tax=Paenibacillus albidus TaxID=2041023 RepID=A0A917BXP7_9BACL|nr:hypothetical protein [Paenibacillus albidus]GGF62256.1 hypothetical protein GCM10010912_04250 [Paenibacillus albidus]